MPGIGVGIGPGFGVASIHAQVQALLRSRGDTLLLPGVGTVNGFASGTYSDSAGTTPAVLEDVLGRHVDAGAGGLVFTQATTADKPRLTKRVNLSPHSDDIRTDFSFNGGGSALSASSVAVDATSNAGIRSVEYTAGANIGKAPTVGIFAFQCELKLAATNPIPTVFFNVDSGNCTVTNNSVPTGPITLTSEWVKYSGTVTVTAVGTVWRIWVYRVGTSPAGNFDIRRIQLNAGATAGRFQSINTATDYDTTGFPYRLDFDSTDTMSATIPAGQGYDDCKIIDAAPGGQVTLTAQNIVGTYTIGPSIATHGRIISRNGVTLTAAQLALYQQFANKLAGL